MSDKKVYAFHFAVSVENRNTFKATMEPDDSYLLTPPPTPIESVLNYSQFSLD